MNTFLSLLLCASVVIGGWKPENETRDLSNAFNPSPFKIHDNWNICMRKILRIPFYNSTQNYIPEFEAAFANLTDGGSILLVKGTYKVSGPVVIPENCCILGAGMDETIIQLNPNSLPLYDGGALLSAAKGILSCSKNERVSVIGITVDGNIEEQYSGHKFFDFGRYGVSFEKCNFAWFRNVRSKNNQLYGFFIRGVGNDAGYYSYVEACVADGNGLDGIELRSMHYTSVYNSIVLSNQRHGISTNGRSRNNLIKDTRVLGSGQYGLKLWAYDENAPVSTLVSHSKFVDSKISGIRIEETVDNTILHEVSVLNDNDKNATCFDTSGTGTSRKVQNLILRNTTCEVLSTVWFKEAEYPGTCTSAGVMSMNVCCKLECGKCGGEGCSGWGKDKSCCISTVRELGQYCHNHAPPCIVS